MYPEAGGSSSFARRAFNEFWSFFAAWGQMLNYVITVAISAFFVPHYIGGLFWEPLRSAPGDIVAGALHHRGALPGQRARRRGVGRAEHPAVGRRLPDAGAAGGGRPRRSCSRPTRWSTTSTSAWRRPGRDFVLAIPIGMIAYTGHRDDLEHGRGGQGRDDDDPGGDLARAARRLRHLLHAAGRRAVGAAGARGGPTTRRCATAPSRPASRSRCSASRRRTAASPATRSSASSRRSTSGRCRRPGRSTSACWPPRSSSSRPTPASSASRGSSTRWASTARCPTRCAACTRGTTRRGSGS